MIADLIQQTPLMLSLSKQRSAPDRLGQARALFALCEGLDLAYTERRIREETAGKHGVQDFQA